MNAIRIIIEIPLDIIYGHPPLCDGLLGALIDYENRRRKERGHHTPPS